MLKHVSRIVLVFFAPAVLAVTSGFTALSTVATDNNTYAARFAIGLSVNGGQSWQTTANVNQNVLIKGSIDPAPEHVGGKADIFVVEWVAGEFSMLTTSGTWVSWLNLNIAELQPAWEDVTLAGTQEVTIHQGSITTSGQHQLYIGYLPASGSALIYTPTPALFEFSAATDAQSYFEAEIFDDLVLTKCSLCHVAGGLAGISDLHFIKDANLAQQNFDIFEAFYRQQADAYNYVLTKVSGGNSHGGGVQLPLGSSDYQKMASFLGLLDGATTVVGPSGSALFTGVSDQSALETLRDASLLLAGRLPTSAETATVMAGGDAALRQVLPQMMQGAHFHEFLKNGANDRLFVRGNEDFNLSDDCPTCFPALNAEYWRLQDAVTAANTAANRGAVSTFTRQLNYSMLEAPLELIAYVVEHDKPYSEILTADYEMLTSMLNPLVGGTAVFANGAGPLEFQPGRVQSYYLRDSATVTVQVPGAAFPRITNPGNTRVNYPHVGVLNSKSFLSRYPSTATNRNRARARWTYYNFLGIDIEALAPRTTDPVALADTNNPTLNNPSCTVCHSVLDPVAGTFQDYGDNGTYRVNLTDSLDRVYKSARGGGLYRTGDTWYRDMRVPGFEGATATTTNTTRWLAELIVMDKRFATATVRFWWPAVMGAELLKAPEVSADADYAARLTAYAGQQDEIDALTDSFVASGLSLKALLTDMVMSRWYRVERLDSTGTAGAARDIANLTDEKLLTPELLARKTHALTGFNWNAQIEPVTSAPLSGLENDYNTFYGGIDSFALKVRARTITPLMSNVAITHALEASCPIILGDFIRPDASRLLFGGLEPWITPLTEASTTQTMTSTSASDFKPTALTVTLQPGAKTVVVSLLNDGCTSATGANSCRSAKNLVIGGISIRPPGGQTTTLSSNTTVPATCDAATTSGNLTLYNSCAVEYAFTAATAGSYTITASLAATQTPSDPVLAGLNIEANVAPEASTAAGAAALKSKLVELHSKLLGQTLAVTSPEVLASYDLLLQTWQSHRAGGFALSLLNNPRVCEWNKDIGFIATLPYSSAAPAMTNGRYNTSNVTTWLGPHAQDPLYMKQTWVVVMTYLLSHYDYLHE